MSTDLDFKTRLNEDLKASTTRLNGLETMCFGSSGVFDEKVWYSFIGSDLVTKLLGSDKDENRIIRKSPSNYLATITIFVVVFYPVQASKLCL